jgi:hypothetical protein
MTSFTISVLISANAFAVDISFTMDDPEVTDSPIYTIGERNDKILQAGESIVWGVAKETGKYEDILRYPGEDGEYEKDEMDKLGL